MAVIFFHACIGGNSGMTGAGTPTIRRKVLTASARRPRSTSPAKSAEAHGFPQLRQLLATPVARPQRPSPLRAAGQAGRPMTTLSGEGPDAAQAACRTSSLLSLLSSLVRESRATSLMVTCARVLGHVKI